MVISPGTSIASVQAAPLQDPLGRSGYGRRQKGDAPKICFVMGGEVGSSEPDRPFFLACITLNDISARPLAGDDGLDGGLGH